MKFEDLVWYVNFYRNKFKTRRNINIYINEHDFESLKTNGLKYFVKWNFTIILYKYQKNNWCSVNADSGGEIFEVLTENERIIKQLLE